MNGEVCCILGVCCPARSLEQRAALAHELARAFPTIDAPAVAEWLLTQFDLAPADTLTDFKNAVARMARAKMPREGV